MAGKRITIEVKGTHQDEEHVRLSDFISQLQAIWEALKHTERVLTGTKKQTVYYRIVGLSHRSPAAVVAEGLSLIPDEDNSDQVTEAFMSNIDKIMKGEAISENIDFEALQAYGEMGKYIEKGIDVLVLTSDDYNVNITKEIGGRVQLLQGVEYTTIGSVSGRIEAINIHEGKNEFRIYPIIGPKKVVCNFPSRLEQEAVESLAHKVTVYGEMKYRPRDKFPHALNVDKIIVHPPDDELPKLGELRGIAPNMTGGMSSEDFVRTLRDGD